MDRSIYKVAFEGIEEISFDEFHADSRDESAVYLYDIKVDNREDAIEELSLFNLDERILKYILEPSDHIRFKFLGKTAYGELAHYSSESNESLKYIGTISFDNILVFVYDKQEDILIDLYRNFPDLRGTNSELDTSSMLYMLINEVLIAHSRQILSYREEIEDFAKDFMKEQHEIEPMEFLEAKEVLSDYSRAIDKIHFTLSFPPARGFLDPESSFRTNFHKLIRTTEVLNDSLLLMSQRLVSLHDHYHMILQEKSNKRLNFLTIIQAIFVPLTLLAGIYGMNFKNMPELEWQYGYFGSLGLMGIISLVFLRYFYKHGWFE